MKNKTLTAALSLASLSLLLFTSSCKKEAGPAGPTGPQGTAGAQGAAGNANVKNKKFTINGSEWINSLSYSYVTKAMPEITSDIVTNGAVMAYVLDDTNKWYALPTTFASSTFVRSFGYYIESGKITFEAYTTDNVTMTAADFG